MLRRSSAKNRASGFAVPFINGSVPRLNAGPRK